MCARVYERAGGTLRMRWEGNDHGSRASVAIAPAANASREANAVIGCGD